MSESRKRIVVGITGASGAKYATRLVDCLVHGAAEVHLIVTPLGKRLLLDELGIQRITAETLIGRESAQLFIHPYGDVGSKLGSGSFLTDGMIVCPCSSNTLASLAAGLADNLLDRAAAVTLKEMRRLVVVPREMPMSRIDLLNALRLSKAGAVICPASPGFYMLPRTMDDLVDFVVGKLLDLVGVPHELNTRWSQQLERSKEDRGEARNVGGDVA
ncbi:MAG: UbiX family flavin prenyltransferase [Phycisphaerae bacterium]|nr:UbiX family flavin prenyltransferase [Phycisphaerae bacterium]